MKDGIAMLVVGSILLVAFGCLALYFRKYSYRRKNTNTWLPAGHGIALAALGIMALVALLLIGGTVLVVKGQTAAAQGGVHPSHGAGKLSSMASKVPQQLPAAVVKALTVRSAQVSCVDLAEATGGSTVAVGDQTVVTPNIGSLKGVPPRKWSDAIEVPYDSTQPRKEFQETEATNCENVQEGAAGGNLLANMTIDHVSILKLDPWLQPFAGYNTTRLNLAAVKYLPLLNVTNPTIAQQHEALVENLAYQHYAELLDTLLTKFQVLGVKTEKSVVNYHLVDGGLVAQTLPEVGLNTFQEDMPALTLALTEKAACEPLVEIGFNTGDRRPELFTVPPCPHQQSVPGSTPTSPTQVIERTGPTTVVTATPPTSPPKGTTPPTTGRHTCCQEPTTVKTPPTTSAPPTTQTTQCPGGPNACSGWGGTSTTESPPTSEPPVPPPTTTPPTTPPPPPPTV